MKAWHQRTLARAIFATVLVFFATLKASIGDGLSDQEILDLIYVPLVAFGGWYGFGALPGVGNLTEPFLNNDKAGDVEVPVPPATPEPA